MKFIAKYIHRKNQASEYYRTIYADSINEAIKKADKLTRNGFIMCQCKSEGQGND